MAMDLDLWVWHLGQIADRIRECAAEIRLCFSFLPDSSIAVPPTNDDGEGIADRDILESFPYGTVVEMVSTDVPLCRDGDSILLDFSRNGLPFFATWDPWSHSPTLRDSWPPGDCSSAVWSTWHYYLEGTERSSEDRRRVFNGMKAEMARLDAIYEDAVEVCRQAPPTVLDAVGDLSLLDDWPSILHYLALGSDCLFIKASWFGVTYPPSEDSLLLFPNGPQAIVTKEFCDRCRYVVMLDPADVATATSHAFDVLRQIADPNRPCTRERIPPEERTIPLSYTRAARLMGKGSGKDAAEWLSASVKDKSIRCEHISRQSHIFSKLDFPQTVWNQILPHSDGEQK